MRNIATAQTQGTIKRKVNRKTAPNLSYLIDEPDQIKYETK